MVLSLICRVSKEGKNYPSIELVDGDKTLYLNDYKFAFIKKVLNLRFYDKVDFSKYEKNQVLVSYNLEEVIK